MSWEKSFALDAQDALSTLKAMASSPSQVLFLCTGNYYRSRYAQALFNHRAAEQALPWKAFSRGLNLCPDQNQGNLSEYTRTRLEQQGLPVDLAGDEPRALSLEDLQAAERIIALKEAEHRPMMRTDFPTFEDKVDYWTVHDLDASGPEEALSLIEAKVSALLQELSQAS